MKDPGRLPPVFVINTYYTGLGIARNLHRHGVPVYGLSSEADAPGVRSRFFEGIYKVPSCRDEPEALCRRLIELRTQRGDAPVIFPTGDFDVLFLKTYYGRLGSMYRLPELSGVDCLLDKLELFKVARAHEIPVPATAVCNSAEEITEEIRKLRFPLVVKPRVAFQWRRNEVWQTVGARKAFLVRSAEELLGAYTRIAEVSPEVLLQEYIEGSDSDIAVCCCYVDREHRMSAYFTARKLRQNPPLFGTGCAVETGEIPEIVPLTEHLLRACNYVGLAEAEFKRDPSSGRWQIIEVNPRHWDQHELGTHAGVNLSWIAYQELIGRRPQPEPVRHEPARIRWIAESEFLMLVLHSAYAHIKETRTGSYRDRMRGYGRAVREISTGLAFLLKSRNVFAIFCWRDPMPGVLLCRRIIRELFGQAMSSAPRRRASVRADGESAFKVG